MAQPPKSSSAKSAAAPAAVAAKPAVQAAAKPAVQSAPAKAAAKPARVASAGERHALIAEAAYFIAQKRGSVGNPQQDWLTAEKQVDDRLKSST